MISIMALARRTAEAIADTRVEEATERPAETPPLQAVRP
jgi:hypothetical protein